MTGDVDDSLQAACERGQEQLIGTDYLAAAATLAEAERVAWDRDDFDTLARLYLPLQESRRQARLRCGEGEVMPRLYVDPVPDPDRWADAWLDQHGQGQFVVHALASVATAAAVRRRAAARGLYVEVLMAAFYALPAGTPMGPGTSFLIPTAGAPLPPNDPGRPLAELLPLLPHGSLMIDGPDLPRAAALGTPATFAAMSALWERLHAPFLSAAEAEPDPLRRLAAFRHTIAVDPGCEFAHQHLSTTARDLARQLARRR